MSFTITHHLTDGLRIWRSFAGFPSPLRLSSESHPWQQLNFWFYPQSFALHFIFLALFRAAFDDVRRDTASSAVFFKSFFSLSLTVCLVLSLSFSPPFLPIACHRLLRVCSIFLTFPHCLILVSVLTWLSCSVVLRKRKEFLHCSTAYQYIWPKLCGHQTLHSWGIVEHLIPKLFSWQKPPFFGDAFLLIYLTFSHESIHEVGLVRLTVGVPLHPGRVEALCKLRTAISLSTFHWFLQEVVLWRWTDLESQWKETRDSYSWNPNSASNSCTKKKTSFQDVSFSFPVPVVCVFVSFHKVSPIPLKFILFMD